MRWKSIQLADNETDECRELVNKIKENLDHNEGSQKKLQDIQVTLNESIKRIQKNIFICKKKKKENESIKEIFMSIFLPIQLMLWGFNSSTIYGINIVYITMILFTVIFGLLIHKLNAIIFQIEIAWEESELKLTEYGKMKSKINDLII